MTHLAKSINIPQEIIDIVIAAIDNDKRSLEQCSLVSSSFLLPSRKQLFSRITLRSDLACQMIHQFLVQNLVIQSSVRAITLTQCIDVSLNSKDRNSESRCQWMNSTSLLAILRLPFRCLERFSISVDPDDWGLTPWNWNSFSSELKDALSNIIHSSNLKTLSLNGVTRMPITFFPHIVQLTTLELHSVWPEDFHFDISSSLTSAASKGVAPTASHPVIDRCKWDLTSIYSEFRSEYATGPEISIFLPFMCCLRLLEINVDLGPATGYDFDILSFLMGSLCISLTSPATLEHLKFDISFRGIPHNSSHFECYTFYENLADANAWSHLDSIITHPSESGSRLQRVDINIDYYNLRESLGDEPDENEVLKAVLDGLPLLRTKDILFVEVSSGSSSAQYHG